MVSYNVISIRYIFIDLQLNKYTIIQQYCIKKNNLHNSGKACVIPIYMITFRY